MDAKWTEPYPSLKKARGQFVTIELPESLVYYSVKMPTTAAQERGAMELFGELMMIRSVLP